MNTVKRHLLYKHLNENIELETGRGTLYKGKITEFDDWGIHFIPLDANLKPVMISWDDMRKIILPEIANVTVKASRPILI
jgi:hypothetical protein